MSERIVYEPGRTTWTSSLRQLAMALLIAAIAAWMNGTWTLWPPSSVLDWLALAVLAVWLLLLLRVGSSYALEGSDLVVLRFGRERRRFPLRDYQTTTTVGPAYQIKFRGGAVSLSTGKDEARDRFLVALQERARAAGHVTQDQVREVDSEQVRVPLALLRFPDRCVACTQPSIGRVELTVQRGFDLVLASFFQRAAVGAPACYAHFQSRTRAGRLIYLLLLPATLVAGTVIKLAVPNSVWGGSMLIGGVVSLLLLRPFFTMASGRLLDWWVLGIQGSALNSDLTEFTLRCRDRAVLAEVLAATQQNTGR